MKIYLVGGAVRDQMFGRETKDYDFAVEAESYAAMRAWLVGKGVRIWQERPEFVTLRGKLPRYEFGDFGSLLPPKPRSRGINADFTLCRAEAMYHDKRHPAVVTPTTILEDLSRRDFTVNAVAIDEAGVVTDPYGGADDADSHLLRVVGRPVDRFSEDPLRLLRALRFGVCYQMVFDSQLHDALRDPLIVGGLVNLPVERVHSELMRPLRQHWLRTMHLLVHTYPYVGYVLSETFPNLWFKPTTEER